MGASDYLEGKINSLLWGSTAYSIPGTYGLALMLVAPSDAGGGTEVANSGSYARKSITNNTTNFPAVAAGVSSTNGVAFTFPAPTGDWTPSGTSVVAWAIYDSATYGAGNLIVFGNLDTPKTILSGSTAPSFAIAALTLGSD